jgi:hypothetical protein
MNDYNVMNDYNAVNDNNAMNEEQVKEPVYPTQTEEAKQEGKKEWQEQATTREVVVNGPLHWLRGEEIDELRSRWNSIQIKFVDEPRTSVEQAETLVADALERIGKVFSNKRTILVDHADISTEDLRIELQSYRSFLNSLLAL